MAVKNSKTISLVVSPQDAEDMLSGNFRHVENKLIKKIQGEFTSLVDNHSERRTAQAVIEKLDKSPAHTAWHIDFTNSMLPFNDAIEAAQNARRDNENKQYAIYDRMVNHTLQKAGVTNFYSFHKWLQEKEYGLSGMAAWEYGHGDHWQGVGMRSMEAEIDAAIKVIHEAEEAADNKYRQPVHPVGMTHDIDGAMDYIGIPSPAGTPYTGNQDVIPGETPLTGIPEAVR